MKIGKRNRAGRRKLLLCAALIAAAAVCTPLLINGYVKSQTADRIVSSKDAAGKQADCILILGAGVHADGTLSLMLEERLKTGVGLYLNGAAPKLLLSGDHGKQDYDEVNAMKQYALDKGVPAEDIFLDHAGFSTYESMYRAGEIFQVSKVIVVSQKYHLYRAIYNGDRRGLDVIGVAADGEDYPGQLFREAREILARDKDVLMGILKPEPTYLGDSIPISGSGLLSQD